MAKYEIDEIKLSRWEAAFRDVASRHTDKTYIRLFFGKNDHWVRNDLRDAFVYKYCDDAGPKAFDPRREYLDIQAQIDPSVDGDEGSVVIPHDFSIRKFSYSPRLFFLVVV